MTNYRYQLPQCDPYSETQLFITNSDFKAGLVIEEASHLQSFSAIALRDERPLTETLRRYYEQYVLIAEKYGVGVVLESPTRQTNREKNQ